MKVYHVKFAYGGTTEPQIRKFIATSAGQAFRKCLREYPGAKLIEAWREGGYTDGYGITSYKQPSVRQLPDQTDQKPKEEQMKFDFRSSCRGTNSAAGSSGILLCVVKNPPHQTKLKNKQENYHD